MQNAQNADIQRVINLVELYRTKVGKESQIAREAQKDYDFWEKENMKIAEEDFANGQVFSGGFYAEGPHTDTWIKHLMVNEQLLGYFYKVVADENADKKVLEQLLPDFYDTTIFTSEEESFLITHFREMVNYIVQTPCNDLKYVNRVDQKDRALIPNEVLSLMKSRVNLPIGAVVYNPFAGFGQIASCFQDCQFYCEESYSALIREWNEFFDRIDDKSKQVLDTTGVYTEWAWLKVVLYANELTATIIEDSCQPPIYDAMMAFIPILPKSLPESTLGNYEKEPAAPTLISKIRNGYKNLRDGGDMILLVPNKALWDSEVEKPFGSFWEELIEEHAITEVFQLPSVMSQNLYDDCCVIIAKKGAGVEEVNMIDAQFAFSASNEIIPLADMASRVDEIIGVPFRGTVLKGEAHLIPKKGCNPIVFDNEALEEVSRNEGYEPISGLRKMAKTRVEGIHPNLLFPQIYVVERPFDEELPCPLSEVCSPITKHIADVAKPVHGELPYITTSDLSAIYQGSLDISKLDRIHEPSEGNDNRTECSDIFAMAFMSPNEYQLMVYKRSIYVDGKNDVVVFYPTEKGIGTALIKAGDTPMAVDNALFVLQPKNGMDAESLIAILNMPVVWRQLKAYKKFGLCGHLDDIIVPTDKRVVGDELSRLKKEENGTKKMKEVFETEQKKHMTMLEDYQHAMRKHIREISSSVRRMERFINSLESSEEIKIFLHERLEVIKTHKSYLSEDIERLNEENTYGEAVPFDIDHCLKGFKDYFGTDSYPIDYYNEVAKEAVKQYLESHRKELHDMDETDRAKKISLIKEEKSFVYVDISEYNFGKVVRNILENARIHGFSSDTSRDDYKIVIVLTWDPERKMYRIDFRNNGDPLPEGLSKDSYGENRKYAGKTGGTGIGGYEVAETVKHYNGDYAISQDGDWVVISVFLPKSKSYEEGV